MTIINKLEALASEMEQRDGVPIKFSDRIDEIIKELKGLNLLAPMVVGEECDLDDLSININHVLYNEYLYCRNEAGYCWSPISKDALPPFLQSLSLVKPIRLIPLKELEEI